MEGSPESERWRSYRRETAGEYVGRYLDYVRSHQRLSAEDYSALDAELPRIMQAVRHAIDGHDWPSVVRFANLLVDADTVLDVRGYWEDYITLGRAGIEAAERIEDEEGVCGLSYGTALILQERGDYAEARALYRRALLTAERNSDWAMKASILLLIGWILQDHVNFVEARKLFEQSL